MSVIIDLLLGIVTSIGGFVEVGSISTSSQAGAEFGFQLLWAIAIADVARSFIPSLPSHDGVRYAFLAISIVGATVSPYLLNFYSSGTIEEDVSEDELWVNTATAYGGNMFGSLVSMGVLVTSAMVIQPLQIKVDSYEQAALMFVPTFGRWAVALFAVSLAIGCMGAALEISLNMGYVLSQVFGWSWTANGPRAEHARFSCAFTFVLIAGTAIALLGFDPLQLTMISVALTVVVMPLMILPFLVLMNDTTFVKKQTNTAVGNAVLALLVVLGSLLAIVVIPLEILGG